MNSIDSFVEASWIWLTTNWQNILLLIISIGIVYFVYLTLSRKVRKLTDQQKIEENIAFTINRTIKWLSGLSIIGIIIAQFGFDFGLIAGFMALAVGTIIGFASMSTLGNAIAGLIVLINYFF